MKRTPQNFLLIVTCIATLVTFLIILLSAYIRLAESGFGCSPWPGCFAHFATDPQSYAVLGPVAEDHHTPRLLHRSLAGLVTVLVLIITFTSFRHRAAVRSGTSLPTAILIVTLLLTMLGINTPNRELPLIAFGNLVGGYVLLALLYWLALSMLNAKTSTEKAAEQRTKSATPPVAASRIVLSAVLLQIASGGWAGANYSTAACSGLFRCSQVGSSQIITGFNLLRQLPLDRPDGVLMDASAASIMMGHHIVSVLFSVVIGVCLYSLFRRVAELRTSLLVLLFFLCATFSLGIVGTVLDMPLWSGILHNLLSILFLLATLRLTFGIHSGLLQHWHWTSQH